MIVLRILFEFAAGAAYLIFGGFALLWASDVILGRAVYWGAFVAGWAVMCVAGARMRRPDARARFDLWLVGGLLGLGCCIAAANLVWPLSNPTSGGFLTGRGVVNYMFLPWLHTAFWVAGQRFARGPEPARG